ncbi:TRAP transporter substrate-binding protein [Nesterenkonia ebinurensis]|uniref:TRAP transporter substrate-binding protein n=1 Tax=Nesterenkonia ebinurensis TaxID=2608252 RepID=UPI00123D8B67|nr:TRAP transporter substrate-binding protein [Nesterenkonia ebinurensis]
MNITPTMARRTALSAAVCLLLASCGGDSAVPDEAQVDEGAGASDAELVIRYGNIYPAGTTFSRAIDEMAEEIAEESDGAIELDSYHGGTLGYEPEMLEGILEGSLEMTQTGTAGIALYVPETALFELWYAYDDLETLMEAFESVRDDLDVVYQEEGFKLLGAFFNGPRSTISTQPIRSLEDMQGVQLRVPTSDLYVDMAEALGANAVTLPLGDAYSGLEQGTIDAQEGSPDDLYSGGFGEVAKYLTLDRHVYHPLSIIYSIEAWEALSEEEQEIIQNAVDSAVERQVSYLEEANEEALIALEEQGVELIELEDREEWAEAVQGASERFAGRFEETGQLITDAMEEAASN